MKLSVKTCRDTLSEIKHVAKLANIEYLSADWNVTISELVIRYNSINHLTSLEYNGSCIYTGTTRELYGYLQGMLLAFQATVMARDSELWKDCLELANFTGTTATHDTYTGLYKLARDGKPIIHSNSPESFRNYLRAFIKATKEISQ